MLDDAVQAGKIQALGVSNFTTSQTAALQQFLDHKLVATQPEISPLHIACFEDGTLDQAMMLGLVPLGWPPQLARRIATLDRILGANPSGGGGRLNINIISSDLPGEKLESAARYGRTTEVIKILRTLLSGDHLDHQGEFYRMKLDPPRMTTLSGKPPAFYFGGLSEDARECAAEGCDVYLMWPDTMPNVREIIADMTARGTLWPQAEIRLPCPRHRSRYRGGSPRLCRPAAVETRRRSRPHDSREVARCKDGWRPAPGRAAQCGGR